MDETIETKVARIEERLTLEVRNLHTVINEFRTDMKTALEGVSKAIEGFGDKAVQTEKNKDMIDSLFKTNESLQEQVNAHRIEDQTFHTDMTEMMIQYKLKQKMWMFVLTAFSGIISSVVTAFIISKVL